MALSSASSLSADVSTSRRRVFMKSASYGDAVVKSLHTLQKEDELCDFTIAAEGKSFRVIFCFEFNFRACIMFSTWLCCFLFSSLRRKLSFSYLLCPNNLGTQDLIGGYEWLLPGVAAWWTNEGTTGKSRGSKSIVSQICWKHGRFPLQWNHAFGLCKRVRGKINNVTKLNNYSRIL